MREVVASSSGRRGQCLPAGAGDALLPLTGSSRMWLVRAALGNVYAVVVLALLIMVLGSVAVLSIPVDILPAFKAPAVQVLTYYNGMPARSTERVITDRIERWVNQSPGVRQVESRS